MPVGIGEPCGGPVGAGWMKYTRPLFLELRIMHETTMGSSHQKKVTS